MTTLRTALRTAALFAALAAPALAQAQTRVFSTATTAGAAPASRCGGAPFLFCVSAAADYFASTGRLTLTVTNTSPSSTSVFGEIGLGNIGAYSLSSGTFTGSGNWDLESTTKLNGYSGVGLDNNNPGLVAGKVGAITNGLEDGETVVFNFFLGKSAGAYPGSAAVLADLSDARLVVHDQGGGLNGCSGSAKISVGNYLAPGATTYQGVTCGPTTTPTPPTAVVPEPATVALMGAGMLGLAGVARRRRTA